MSNLSLLAATAAVTTALAGCKPTPAATTAVDNAAAVDDFLVWTESEDGKTATTIWIDADGHEHGRTAGIVIARAGALYRLERVEHQVAVDGCGSYDEEPAPEPPEPGVVHTVYLASSWCRSTAPPGSR
jgi:hypothetical protein